MKKSAFAFGVFAVTGLTTNGIGFAQTAGADNAPIQAPALPAVSQPDWKFGFGTGKAEKGFVAVPPSTLFAPERGYGFELGAAVNATATGGSSEQPFLFSAAVPEGNYRVTVKLGDKNAESTTTVKAEARRLMVENVHTAPGQFETRTFLVNVRTPRLPNGDSVRINGREQGPPIIASWDDKLTVEFNGVHSSAVSLEIARIEDVPTIFLAGDSTVTDCRNEPWAAWGMMLPRFFKPTAAVANYAEANYAEAGLTLGSFRGQKRLEKLLITLKKGDYVFIQFGHNDQKDKGENAGPFKSYKSNLLDYVKRIRDKGGVPVLVTSMERRRWSEGKPQSTLSAYAEAARQVGQEEQVPVIDLNAMSLKLYEALGQEGTKKAFVHFPLGSFPGQKEALKDDTHFTNYGAYELARCVVTGIREKVPALVPALMEDMGTFDPSHPDAFEGFRVPNSPYHVSEKPAGS